MTSKLMKFNLMVNLFASELREKIKPEIIELIKEQRLHYLVEGTQFTKYSSRGARMKGRFMIRLDKR